MSRWLVLLAACAAPPQITTMPVTKPAPPPVVEAAPVHDPDHARGALPPAEARRTELATIRKSLDGMYAHRVDKLRRNALDEDALFADLETRLSAALTWVQYDAAIYDALARFHDGHLTYHPPATAAPARGYDSYYLGFTTVLAGTHLLVATGASAGDEITAIDGVPVARLLDRAVAGRVWSRPESARTDFARTWTQVLYPKDTAPRTRTITVRQRLDGTVHDVAIAPERAVHAARVAIAHERGVAVVTIHALDGGRERATLIDRTLAEARAASGIVIDLRGDRGGVDAVGYRVVADLAEGQASLGSYRVLVAPETLARRPHWKQLTAAADGFSPPQPLTVPGLAAGAGFHGALAVIVDASCASTCEVVTAALRADLHAVIIGEVTAGSSGAPVEVTLPAGRGAIAIPTWDLTSAEGLAIESEGVVPDVAVVATAAALAAGDDLPLHAALDRLGAP